MKKITLLACLISLIHTHHSVCMEATEKKQFISSKDSNYRMCKYLVEHTNPSNTINMCKKVAKLINKGININQQFTNTPVRYCYKTPIEVAITIAECSTCAKLLRKNGANPDYRSDDYERTPLMTAIYNNNQKHARLYLECDANPYTTWQHCVLNTSSNGGPILKIDNVFDIAKKYERYWFREMVEKPHAIVKYWLLQEYIRNSNALVPELIPLIMRDLWEISINQ